MAYQAQVSGEQRQILRDYVERLWCDSHEGQASVSIFIGFEKCLRLALDYFDDDVATLCTALYQLMCERLGQASDEFTIRLGGDGWVGWVPRRPAAPAHDFIDAKTLCRRGTNRNLPLISRTRPNEAVRNFSPPLFLPL